MGHGSINRLRNRSMVGVTFIKIMRLTPEQSE